MVIVPSAIGCLLLSPACRRCAAGVPPVRKEEGGAGALIRVSAVRHGALFGMPSPTLDAVSVTALVERARAGDDQAWSELVERYAGLVWSIASAHRLSRADAADVNQVTWLRLVEHLDRLKEPEAVAGWLATTARNECLAVIRRAGRQVPVEPDRVIESDTIDVRASAVDEGLLDSEASAAVRVALRTLPEHCQVLLRLLVAEPPLSYDEI